MSRLRQFLKTTTGKLALSYLAIIMLMSLGFSVVFYNTSYRALGRQLPPPNMFEPRNRGELMEPNQTVDDFFRDRINEARQELLMRLVGLNILILVGGSAISYYLARRTLKPIEDNMEAQSQFISDASHELRTPLAVLRTLNEVALRKKKVSSAEAREVFEHNIEEVAKLRQLTDSLLHLAKNDKNTVTFSSLDIADIVSDALNTIIPIAQEKHITVEDSVPKLMVQGSKASLTQLLVIILDNAVKYSPENGVVYVTASKDNKSVSINIKDEGPGIKAVHLPHIFERFYRAETSRNKNQVDGFGIGLALAKKIAEQHNGEIVASSTLGKGSTFTLRLPLS